MTKSYSIRFYSDRGGGALISARKILGYLLPMLRPSSVVDVGCGNGSWLAAAKELGVSDLVGVDGDWARSAIAAIDGIRFIAHDLGTPIELSRRFDFAISLEVAEHLDPNRAETFVAELANLADLVLFSAAIPGQGGTHHVNEQWQSFWVSHFENCGMRVIDAVRPVFWNDNTIEFWYRQNAFVFVRDDDSALKRISELMPVPGILDIVHPELFRSSGESRGPLGRIIRRLKTSIWY